MFFLDHHQYEVFEHTLAVNLQNDLSAEILRIRTRVPGVDHTIPTEEVVARSRRFSEQYGLTAASDLRNLVVTALFLDHAGAGARTRWLYDTLSGSDAPATPLGAHLLAVHTKNLERSHDWSDKRWPTQ